ncbi:MAG: DNA alkylation repair protein [Actinomycetota bacterium]|nr:DNA alkylation repair protein [Actinomycetota bacterium]
MEKVEAIDLMEAGLRAMGTAERAAGEKKYLKSELDFLGATVGDTRRVVHAFSKEHPGLSHDELVDLVEGLWDSPVFERKMAAVMLLQKRVDQLGVEDLRVAEHFIRTSKTWALVDPLAVDIVGQILRLDNRVTRTLDRWARDGDFWVRRSALLAHLKGLRTGEGLERFTAYADTMLEQKEFFIRKAIGWVLREAGKKRPEDVAAWLGPRTHRASGVTMREAVKYLSAKDSERLLTAYRDRRPADSPHES